MSSRVSGPTVMVRGVSGVLTGGLVVLALVVVVVAVLASWRSVAGPSSAMVFIHVAAAAVAVLIQVAGDRRGRSATWLAGAAVLAISAVLLWTQWWA